MAYWVQLLIICPLVFFAGFVDSIAGGGGLISMPAYLAIGLPAHIAQGTNKFSSAIGTTISTAAFVKRKQYESKTLLYALPGSVVGSTVGSVLAVHMNEAILRIVIILCVPIIGYFVLFKLKYEEKLGEEPAITREMRMKAIFVGIVMGFYDGIFGPGTGTFLIIGNMAVVGLSMYHSLGNTKILNLTSALISLVIFMMNGKVNLQIGVPAMVANVLGNHIGNRLVLSGGKKVLKPMLLFVLSVLLIKLVSDQVKIMMLR